MTAVATGLRAFNPKDRVPVNGKPIPRFRRFVLTIAWSYVVAFLVAEPIIMTGYFFITQVKYPGHIAGQPIWMKPYWDRLLDAQLGVTGWTLSRHLWRNLLDPILGTIFVKSLLANWKKDPDTRCSMWYLIASPFIILVIATILISLVAGLVYWWVPQIGNTVPNGLIQVVAGIVIGLVVHPIYAPAGRTVQGFFVDRQVWKARWYRFNYANELRDSARKFSPKGWMPPVVQELFWHKIDNKIPVKKAGAWVSTVVPTVAFLIFAAAVFGLIIKFGIAPGRIHWFNT